MNRVVILIAATLSGLASATAAGADECSCLWEGSFAEVHESADVVLAGTVVSAKGNSMDVRVDQRLRDDPYREEIRIWMQARDYCRPPVDDFPVGSSWILALKRIEEVPPDGFDPGTPNISYGREDDFYLSSCGGYWLERKGDVVTGNLVDGPRWARETEMTPVLVEVIEAYVTGEIDTDALRAASREDPALRELMLDTRSFLRHGE